MPTEPRPAAPASLVPALTFLSAVRLVTNTGYRFLYPFLPVVARGLGVSLERAGLLISGLSLAGLTTPAVAALNARRGERHRRLATVGLLAFAAGAALAAATTVYVAVLAGFVLLGAAKPVYDVAAHSYLAERTPYARRARILAVIELTWAGALLIGAPATGWLIHRAGWRAPLWVFAALGGLSLVAVPWALDPDRPEAEPGTRTALILDRSSVALLVVTTLFSYGAEVTFVVFGAWLERDFGVSVLGLGALSTLIGVAELLGSSGVVAFGDRIGKRPSVTWGLLLAIVGFAALPLTDDLAPGLAALALALFGFEFTIVSAIPLASEAHPQARSRYLALMVAAISLPRAVAAATGPALFTRVGLAGNAAVAVGANLAALMVLRRFVADRPPEGGDGT